MFALLKQEMMAGLLKDAIQYNKLPIFIMQLLSTTTMMKVAIAVVALNVIALSIQI